MSTASGHTASSVERPERSRNAKAQARHRAKRKAYIEQLEQTVTKLQAALGYSPEQVSALPPSSITIRELQQDNIRLQKEIEDLRRALAEVGGGNRRGSMAPYPDPRNCDRDYKRRKMSGHLDAVYLPSDSPHLNERPPPLTIPQPLSHHYGNIPSHNGSQNGPSSLFNLHGPAFQMPNTPSGSSATSSPPFSASIHLVLPSNFWKAYSLSTMKPRNNIFALPLQPIQMQAHVNPLDQRPSQINNNISNYSQHGSQYGNSVKVEDDSYHGSNHHSSSIPYSTYSNPQHDMDWHTYSSSERAHNVHR